MPPAQGTRLLLRREHVVAASLVGAVVVVVGFASGLGVHQVVSEAGQPTLAEPRAGRPDQPSTGQSTEQPGQADQSTSDIVGDQATGPFSNSLEQPGISDTSAPPVGTGASTNPQPGNGAAPPSPAPPPCAPGVLGLGPVLELVTNAAGDVVGTVDSVAGTATQNLGQVAALPLPLGGLPGAVPSSGSTTGTPGQATAPPGPVCSVPPAPSPPQPNVGPSQANPIPAPSTGVPVPVLGGGQ
jgi:hypothetical protein